MVDNGNNGAAVASLAGVLESLDKDPVSKMLRRGIWRLSRERNRAD
ncbi:hypothetical protein [Bifidobacterium tsurumiense]